VQYVFFCMAYGLPNTWFLCLLKIFLLPS
jgi:hypothetical protein